MNATVNLNHESIKINRYSVSVTPLGPYNKTLIEMESSETFRGHSLIHSKPLFIKEEKGLIETYNHHHHHNRHPMSFLPVDNNTLLNYASRGLNNNHNSSPSSPGGQEGQLRHAGTSSGPASDINNGTGMLMAGYHHHHHHATAAASPYYPHPYSHAHHLSMSSHHHHQRLVGVNSAAFQDFPTSAMSHHQQCTPAEGHHHPHLLPPLTAINDYSSLYTMEHHHHYHASSHRQYGGGGSNSVATFPQTSYNNGTGGGSAIGFGVSSGHANNQSNGIVSSKGANSINEGGNGSKSGRTYDLRNHQIHQNKSGGDGGAATNCGLGNDGGMAIGNDSTSGREMLSSTPSISSNSNNSVSQTTKSISCEASSYYDAQGSSSESGPVGLPPPPPSSFESHLQRPSRQDERTQNSSPTSSNGSTNSEGGEAPPHPILVGSSQWGSLSISSTAMSSNFSSPSGAASSHQNHHLTSVHATAHPSLQSSGSPSGSSSSTTYHQRRGSLQLWQFLVTLLDDPNNAACISWTGRGMEFKLIEPEEVARRWGLMKNRPAMNYDKLSRSLRYYYEKGIMQKVAGERYVYKFVCDPEALFALAYGVAANASVNAAAVAAVSGVGGGVNPNGSGGCNSLSVSLSSPSSLSDSPVKVADLSESFYYNYGYYNPSVATSAGNVNHHQFNQQNHYGTSSFSSPHHATHSYPSSLPHNHLPNEEFLFSTGSSAPRRSVPSMEPTRGKDDTEEDAELSPTDHNRSVLCSPLDHLSRIQPDNSNDSRIEDPDTGNNENLGRRKISNSRSSIQNEITEMDHHRQVYNPSISSGSELSGRSTLGSNAKKPSVYGNNNNNYEMNSSSNFSNDKVVKVNSTNYSKV